MWATSQVYANGILINGFDYERQAWVRHGVYVPCGHPNCKVCDCYGRIHQGEPSLATMTTDKQFYLRASLPVSYVSECA